MDTKTSEVAKHTPGPWGATTPGNGLMPEGMIGVGATLANVAMVEMRHPEWEANARLIAAAPDLLEACKRVLRALAWNATADRMSDDDKAELLSNAIAKAEGRGE